MLPTENGWYGQHPLLHVATEPGKLKKRYGRLAHLEERGQPRRRGGGKEIGVIRPKNSSCARINGA